MTVSDASEVWGSDIVVKVAAPTPEEVARLTAGATVISLMAPGLNPDLVDSFVEAKVTGLAMDAVPADLARAVDGRAVVDGQRRRLPRRRRGRARLRTPVHRQVTAAGKVPPAKVFVVGAGVAGLAAIGAAGSMGAVVRAFDVRPEVAEQVESMGAQFVSVEMEREVSSDGYAKEMTPEQVAATAAMYDEEARNADIVITTALIPAARHHS